MILRVSHAGSRRNPCSPVEILELRSMQLCKSLYDTDEAIREVLLVKNADDDLVHELDYTRSLLDIVCGNDMLTNILKVR